MIKSPPIPSAACVILGEEMSCVSWHQSWTKITSLAARAVMCGNTLGPGCAADFFITLKYKLLSLFLLSVGRGHFLSHVASPGGSGTGSGAGEGGLEYEGNEWDSGQ